MSLSSLIVQREVATIRQVEEALARQVLYGGDLVTNLLEVAQLPEEHLVPLLAESLGMKHAMVGELPAPDEMSRTLVPEELATRRAVMPLKVEDDRLLLAVAEPLAADVIEELSFALGVRIDLCVAPMVRIRQAISTWYGIPLDRRMQRLVGRLGGADLTDPGSLPPLLRSAPPVPEAPRPVSVPSAPRLPSIPARTPSDAVPAPVAEPVAAVRQAPSAPPPAPAAARPRSVPPQKSAYQPSDRTTNQGFPAAKPSAPEAAPASFVQRGREGLLAKPGRRRRGPLPLTQAKEELDEAADRDTLLQLLFDFGCQFFDYTALFVVHGDIAEGRDAFGSGASRDTVAAIGVPLDMPSLLATAREQCAPLVVRPSADGLDRVLMSDLERKTRTPVLVVPVVVRQRAVALLLGDGGDGGVDGSSQSEVTAFGILVGQAFERIIVRRKLAGFAPGAGPEAAKVDPLRVASKPPAPRSNPPGQRSSRPPPINREAAAGALERALGTRKSERPGAARPLPSPLAESPPPMRVAEPVVSVAEPLREVLGDTEVFEKISDKPPPPHLLVVRRPSLPPIPREEPEIPSITLEATPSLSALAAPSFASEFTRPPSYRPPPDDRPRYDLDDSPPIPDTVVVPPPSQAVVVPAHRPPPPARAPASSLPSVIVDVEREFVGLVDRLIADASDEQAEAELLRQGAYAMPAIMARFPGPISVTRERLEEEPPPRVTECGPILRLIAGQRRVALPFVLAQVDSRDTRHRFWATYLLAELAYPEAVPAVVARLFDEDEPTRRVARLAARAVAEVAPEPMVEGLDRIVADAEAGSPKRIATIDTLGDMRDPIVVPALIGALGDPNTDVVEAARRGLTTVTRQDFGDESRRWLTWWGSNSSRHRIEWLIDALTHELPALRRLAGQELKAITKEYFGYYDDLPKKERERAQLRYRDWWKTEGRARFRRA